MVERVKPVPPGVQQLRNGDRMNAETFHRIYLDTPEDFRAELVGGVVYVASPLGLDHATNDSNLGGLLAIYAGMTKGVQCGHGATIRLGEYGEPQPDLFVRILPEYGGQSRTEGNFIVGAPELVAEVAHSSWAIDLGDKYNDYRRYGVLEYIVLDLHGKTIRWFDLKADKELNADVYGVIRVKQFPGLWLNVAAILAGDFPKMKATLEEGMTTEEWREFAKRIQMK